MNKKTVTSIMIICLSLNFFYAISFNMYSSLLPSLIESYGLTMTKTSLLSVTENIGSCCAMFFTMLAADRFSKGLSLSLGVGLYGLSLLLSGSLPPFAVFLLARVSLGMFGSFLDSLMTAYISDIFAERRAKAMSILHLTYSIGNMLAPVSAAWFLKVVGNWTAHYIIMGSVMLVNCFLLLLFVRKNGLAAAPNPGRNEKIHIPYKEIFTSRRMLTVLASSFFMSSFIYFRVLLPTFLISIDPARYPVTIGSGMLTSFSVGAIVGRLAYTAVADKIKAHSKLAYTCIATAVILICGIALDDTVVWYAVLFLVGLLHASNFSVKFQMACEIFPKYSATVVAAATLFSSVGMIVFSTVTGLIADSLGYGPAMFLAPAGLLISGALVLLGYRAPKVNTNTAQG